jgi:cyclopropane-fatty-acyl-phospholipid synthase
MTAVASRFLSVLDDRRAAGAMREILAGAGVTVGGDAPWDIQVHDPRTYTRVLRDGTLGVGESYVEGWWDCAALDQMIDRVTRARVGFGANLALLAHAVKARVFNLQATRAFEVGLVYTCAYWKDADTLEAAQEAKLDLVCRKIGLRPGMRVLDLGCGWGGFASFAAEHYGASVVGYTVSREQVAWIKEHYPHLPIDVRLDDYRNAAGNYDAVVSIGLMEHVGSKNYRAYMELAARLAAPGAVIFMHTIGGAGARTTSINPWFDKYIFPNANIPTLGQLADAMEEILVPEDVQNIGPHYDRTLMAWWANFDAAWPTLRARYGDSFYRMWKFYLLSSAAYFRARRHNLYQIVATTLGSAQPPTVRAT